MKLLPLDSTELLELAAGWLARPENDQWLDFGNGRQVITPVLLKMMSQNETHFIRAFTGSDDKEPIGLCGLNNVNRTFGTASLWGLTGSKSFRNRGYATFAGSKFLTLAFNELDLYAINAWAVAHNPSIRILERLNFRYIGRQRMCHRIHGKRYDRLLFDLLVTEHRERELPSCGVIGTSYSDRVAAS